MIVSVRSRSNSNEEALVSEDFVYSVIKLCMSVKRFCAELYHWNVFGNSL